MTILAATGGSAEAGVLKGGSWMPTGCGTEPTAPVINGSSPAAYDASIKLANAYQTAAKQYEDCYFKEAQADSNAINAATQDHQHELQATYDKLSADSKAAVDRLKKKQ
jgi:hypothetical protein